jgi:uncharacterized protein YqhQ
MPAGYFGRCPQTLVPVIHQYSLPSTNHISRLSTLHVWLSTSFIIIIIIIIIIVVVVYEVQ